MAPTLALLLLQTENDHRVVQEKQQVEAVIVSVGLAQITSQDRSLWKLLRPSVSWSSASSEIYYKGMSQTRDQQRFTISEVTADWHEPMVPQRIMWPSIARANGQLDQRCS